MNAINFDDDLNKIVIDQGSGSIKAGIAGDDEPRVIVPNIIGRPRQSNIDSSLSMQEYYIGHQARLNRDFLSMKYPMEHGMITNWDDMERIWHHIFVGQLNIAADQYPMLLSESVLNPKGHREKMAQILFEKFNLPALFIAYQPHLSFYCMGRTCGIILEIGDTVTQIYPIIEGHHVPRAIQRLNLGGRDLTDQLANLLMEHNYCFSSTAGQEIVRDIKEKHCYVALDFEQELKTSQKTISQKYKLPDGETLTLSHERFKCTEALFKPAMLGYQHPGIIQSLYNSIMACDTVFRKDLLCNIIMAGGSTFIPGLEERMQKEMTALVPNGNRVRFVVTPERRLAAWIGGSILCSLSTFQREWITKQEYEEYGPAIVHLKCNSSSTIL